jgi:hypothetical protein
MRLIMRLKLIACKVLSRVAGELSAVTDNFIDITYIRQGFHNEPEKLQKILQNEIDLIDGGDDIHSCNNEEFQFDAILLGYGLCSNGVMGIKSKKYPIVIPRAHDCITLFLGSKERYRSIFDSYSGGVYWYTPGWIESCIMPSEQKEQNAYKIYEEIYGEDNAQYLIEMENGWYRDYKLAAYIKTGKKDFEDYRLFTQQAANYLGWGYTEFDGDSSLLKDFLNGNWDNERFLMIQPGQSIQPSFDEGILRAE